MSAAAAAALLSRVVETPGILTMCTEYQDGMRLAEYPNGDVAAAEGHLSLLKMRRQLCTGVRVDEGGSVSGNVSGEGKEPAGYAKDLRYTHCAADWAATQGHLEVVKWLLKNRQEKCTESAVDGACWNGHSEIIEWLVCDWGQDISERALDYAASTGRLELVKWLTKRGAKCTSIAMDGAAGDGHLDVVRWLGQNRREGCSRAAFEMAAAGGHLHVIEWLDEAGLLRCSSRGLDNAAEGGHLDVLKWMQERKAEHQCTSNAYGLAASTGRLEVLEWLRDTTPNLCCPAWSSEIAAKSGHLTVVKWLHETGLCRASLAVLDDAAALGRLEAVVWLSEHGARATEAAVDRAAEAGYADVVAYLLENRQEGCSPNATVEAARNGHLAVMKVLLQHGQEQFGNLCLEAKSVAGAQGHDEVVRWLEEGDSNRVKDLEEALRGCAFGKSSADASLALPDEAQTYSGTGSVGNSGPDRESEAVRPIGIRECGADDDPGRDLSEERAGCVAPIAGDFLVDEAWHCNDDHVGTDDDEVLPTKVREGEVKSDEQGASLPGQEGISLTDFVRRLVSALVSGFVPNLSSPDDRGRTPAAPSGERKARTASTSRVAYGLRHQPVPSFPPTIA